MIFAREFFDLQFSFAEVARDLSGRPLEATLLDYTNFYVRFGFGRDFEPGNEGWKQYVAGLRCAADPRDWTYRFYVAHSGAMSGPRVEATVGCFSYARLDESRVRLHFRNTDSGDHSPLDRARVERRRAELAELLAHLRPDVGRETLVVGASWLYNLPAYRRLFPPDYVASARPIRGAFRSMPLWGQFLDRRGRLRESMAEPFTESLSRVSKLGDLGRCFPLEVLGLTARARVFFDFYDAVVVSRPPALPRAV